MNEAAGDGSAGTRLSALARGGRARVTGIDSATPVPVAQRLRDLGFRADTTVSCLRRAPLGSPTIYRVGESDVCLRRSEADHVTVEVQR
ncbi:MAG: FeoA family protein [Kineosporiaceae bacterium]